MSQRLIVRPEAENDIVSAAQWYDEQKPVYGGGRQGPYDCIVVATHHDAFDWALIQQHAQLIVDTRGVYLAACENVVKA